MTAPARRADFRHALRVADFDAILRDGEVTVTYAEMIAKKLSFAMQLALAEHAAGERPAVKNQREVMITSGLIARGLIRYPGPSDRTRTIATEKGRAVIAFLLGKWADVLMSLEAGEETAEAVKR